MKATLNSFIDNNDKIKYYIAVCKNRGIEVLPPDVNKSGRNFEVDYDHYGKDKPAIRFGLKGIKSLGAKSEIIIEERNAHGRFNSYQDFVKRMIGIPKFDKAAIVALILTGALDEFEGTRKNKLEVLEILEKRYKSEAVLLRNGQMTIFSLAEELGDEDLINSLNEINSVDTIFTNNEEYDQLYKLDQEKEYTGFYITAHPVDIYKKTFEREGADDIITLTEASVESDIITDEEVDGEVLEEVSTDSEKSRVGEEVTVAGIIKDVIVRYTKKDSSKMKTFVIEDDTDSIRCVIFPKKLAEGNADELTEEKQIVLLTGTLVADESFGLQILVNSVKSVNTLNSKPKRCIVKFNNDAEVRALFNQVKILSSKTGIDFMAENHKGKIIRIGAGYFDNSLSNLNKLHEIVGENNVIVE